MKVGWPASFNSIILYFNLAFILRLTKLKWETDKKFLKVKEKYIMPINKIYNYKKYGG